MLETRRLTKSFGGLSAVNSLDLHIKAGEIIGLIGPNGAGKTTVFNLITGYIDPSEGEVMFRGENVVGQKPHKIAERGIVRTFQIAKLFRDFTVLQNMLAASHLYAGIGFWQGTFRTGNYSKKEEKGLDRAMKSLSLVGLEPWRDSIASTLPHAHQKLLATAMALAAAPKLLLLDEPLEGMSAEEVDKALQIIDKIRAQGITVLLIEHNMRAVMKICDRIFVLNFGQKIAEGTPEEVKQNKDVIRAYLGACEYAD
jgi:branched-chain amino acid transport system ATP-binding protein